MVSSCTFAKKKNESTPYVTIAKGQGYIPTPPKRSRKAIDEFKRNLKHQLSIAHQKPEFSRLDPNQRQDIARQIILKEIGAKGGIRYDQLHSSLVLVFDPETWQCAQMSCSVPYHIKPPQLMGFLDQTRHIVEGDEKLAQKDRILWEQMIGSLTVGDFAPKDLKKMLSELPELKEFPKESIQEAKPLPAKAFDVLNIAELNTIKAFTTYKGNSIRYYQIKSIDDLMLEGFSKNNALQVKAQGKEIDQILKKLPPSPGTVYRGIRVGPDQILDLFEYKSKNSLVTLGQDNLPATSSASISLQIGEDFSKCWAPSYGVLLVIRQKSGISIEEISAYPKEQEVVIPGSSLFQITKISRISRFDIKRTDLVVEMAEYPTLVPSPAR